MTVSYFEWAQDIQREAWSEDAVLERLRAPDAERHRQGACEPPTSSGVDWRTAAQAVAIEPVAQASALRAVLPVSGGGPADWDAGTYDHVADPQEEWGREVLARLDARGRRDRARRRLRQRPRDAPDLRARCPRGQVIGVDAVAVDDRARARAARGVRRPGRAPGRRPARARARPSRSTRCSPTRPSTGSSTTSGSSPACSRRCARAGGSRSSSAAWATSPSGPARSSRSRATSASPPTCAGCPTCTTSPRSATPRRG